MFIFQLMMLVRETKRQKGREKAVLLIFFIFNNDKEEMSTWKIIIVPLPLSRRCGEKVQETLFLPFLFSSLLKAENFVMSL